MATSTGQGLAALQQADIDLAAAVTTQTQVTSTAVAAIQAALANLGQSEDPAVAAEAAKIEAAVALINQSNANLTTAVATLPPPVVAPPA